MEIKLASENLCTGCSACANICPKGAIEMIANEEGFLFPVINQDKCIKCGQCQKVCPVLNKKTIKPKQSCYAIMADDRIRYKSASGGAFSILAENILMRGGYVYGCGYDENLKAKHLVISQTNQIDSLISSKYVQSDLNSIFIDIKNKMKYNKPILFAGTPCQIAGLKSFLKKDCKNVLTVDLICHGAPSPLVFEKYKQEFMSKLLSTEKLIDINFRSKINGWTPYLLLDITTTTTKTTKAAFADDYMKAFLNNLSLRKSCNNCPFATIKRQSDITIGDFWWIARYNKKYDDNKGTSLVITNSKKGASLLNQVKKDCKLFKKVPVKIALKYNGSLNQGSKEHRNRSLFFNNLDKMSLKDNVKQCLDDKFDIGIINYWWAPTNYGALLTGYALQQVLKELGYSSRLIDNKYMNLKKPSDYEGTFNYDFYKKYLVTTEPLIDDKDYEALNLKTRIFITGSDQVFAPKWMGPHFEKYFLEFADIDAKKIAFSASFGVDDDEFLQEDFYKNKMAKALKTFDYISTREDSGVAICKNIFDCEADWIVDPVFIMNKSKYDELADKADIDYSEKIVSYVLDNNEKYRKVYKFLEEKYNAETVKTYESNISAESWLASIRDCKYFITDSFHGACFALIFNKPFVCLVNRSRGYARFSSLIKMFNLPKIYFDDISELEKEENLFEKIDYEQINQEIENRRKFAIDRLLYAINKSKEIDNTTLIHYVNLLKSRITDLEENTNNKRIKNIILMWLWSLLPKPVKSIIKRYFL